MCVTQKEPHPLKKPNVVFLRDQSWVHYFFIYLLMIFSNVTKLLDPIILIDDTSLFYSNGNTNKLVKNVNKEPANVTD